MAQMVSRAGLAKVRRERVSHRVNAALAFIDPTALHHGNFPVPSEP
jgi:hypothetical protein